MPLNKQTIFIIGGVVVILLIIVYINNQTKTLKTELKTLAEEHDEFKQQTIGHIRNLYGIVSPESLMNRNVGRKVVGDVKITKTRKNGGEEKGGREDREDEEEKEEENREREEENREDEVIQQEIDKINELEKREEKRETREEKKERKEERKEDNPKKELYVDITGNKSGQVLEPVPKEELDRIRQEEMNKFRK